MKDMKFPFSDEPNTACFTCRHVLGEGLPYLCGRRRDASHKPCGKKVAGGLHILNQAFFHGSVA